MNEQTASQSLDEQLAEQQQALESLRKQFAATSDVEVTGVVDANGPAGCKLFGASAWQLSFSLEAWRIADGPVCKEHLVVRRDVADEELSLFQDTIDAEAIVRLRAKVVEKNVLETPQAYLEEFVGFVDDDPELKRIREEMQEVITFDDEVLGRFTFDRSLDWYVGTATWSGKEIDLNLSVEAPDSHGESFKSARSLLGNARLWKRRIDELAVEKLLALKNDSWLEEGEQAVTADEFVRRMTLTGITVHEDGSFSFSHDDGDLFFGHSIVVSGNVEAGPQDAYMAG